jgi:bifunctional non-homologous end joining protein LigD
MAIAPIIPAVRREPFDGPEWTFELKFDGFRGIADTLNGRMISKRGNRMERFESLLAALPAGCILDGEIVALDEDGRPRFHDLMFSRRAPVYAAFDVLVARGEDVRSLPLTRRKAILKRLAKGAQQWIAIVDGVPGEGRRLFGLIADMNLEGMVAKRLADPYAPGITVWWKVLNRSYSQKERRWELFERQGRAAR